MPVTTEEQDEQFYRDTEAAAFPKLDDYQLSLLEPLGQRRVLKRGDTIFKAGQRDFGLTIMLRGELEVFEQRDGTEQILATAHPRDFIGDVSMLQGTSALASARVTSDESEVLHVPAAELRRALAEIPGVSTTIVNALIMRRRRLNRDREFQLLHPELEGVCQRLGSKGSCDCNGLLRENLLLGGRLEDPGAVQLARGGGVERVDGEARLARAADAGDAGEGAEREIDGDVGQVVGGRAVDGDALAAALAAGGEERNLAPALRSLDEGARAGRLSLNCAHAKASDHLSNRSAHRELSDQCVREIDRQRDEQREQRKLGQIG